MGTVLGLFALVFVGCGDATTDDTGQADGQNNAYLMVPTAGTDIAGEVTGDVELGVMLYDRSSGEPVENAPVQFDVSDEEDEDPLSLTAGQVYSDEQGVAAVEAFLGTQEGTWEVEATNSSSNSVTFEVQILPAETGDLEVELVHPAPGIMDLSDIDLRVYRASHFDCNWFEPLLTQDEETVADAYTPFVGDSVTVENLSVNNAYVVTAIARGEQGQIAAGGCMSSVIVQADQTTDREMILQLIPLNPAGTYDVLSHWDFTDALADAGPAGSVIVTVLDIFENPGQGIYDEIINLVGELVGGLISATIDQFLSMTGLDTQLQNAINNFIDDSDGLSAVRDAGQELRQVVANLEVHSELSIGKMAQDFEFRGQDNWLGLTLYWSGLCEDNDPDPDCDAIELKAEQDGEFADLGVLSSSWTGRVAAFDQLQIDQHAVSLRYGRLIRFILNDVMLPAVTDGNANSMSEAFSYWFGCDSIVGTIISGDEVCAFDYCLEADTVEDFCETAVSTVFSFADILIDSLEYDMGLRLGGEGRLIEETSDGLVDRIEDGVFEGYIDDGDGSGTTSSFSATFEAQRASYPGD